VPALAERLEDLPLLSQFFIEQLNARGPKQISGPTPEALDELAIYAWPGQIRELQETIELAHAKADGHEITVADLPERIHLAADAAAYPRHADEPIVLAKYLAAIEHELIERALARAKGNKTKAAKLLGMTRPRFYRRLVQLGLESIFAPEEGPD
jgi:DNA-binding NtrC family response regulator